MSTLFFHEMNENDEFILSKGHAAPILWAAYAEAGFIPLESLTTLRDINSTLEGHPTPRMPLIKVATGSLGQGLAAGAGMALAKKLIRDPGRTYVLMGDGECAEGSVWETANSASYYYLNNLCTIIDVNRLGQSGPTMHEYDLRAYEKKFNAFGWDTKIVDGHKVQELIEVFREAKNSTRPFAVIAKTIKGKGVSFLENREGLHGSVLDKEQLRLAIEEIGKRDIKLISRVRTRKTKPYAIKEFSRTEYRKGDLIATRKAFGKALSALGEKNDKVIVIDSDVKNSTRTLEFMEKYPARSFQSFIAEQNMVGMAIGFSAMDFVPFVATFSTFLTRAHDFIRMADYSRANVNFIGSHAGVSIGADGPSQMGLEDLPMFLSMPDSTVLYPSDAVSTQYLVGEIAKHPGIWYLRTTRSYTAGIYGPVEKGRIGDLKLVKKTNRDDALVISAGITLNEALKAHDILKKDNISLRVIDLYSIKPFDASAISKNAEECKKNVIIVEDHYCYGIATYLAGIIANARKLCISGIPHSGSPEKLMAKYGIVAEAIANTVKQILWEKGGNPDEKI